MNIEKIKPNIDLKKLMIDLLAGETGGHLSTDGQTLFLKGDTLRIKRLDKLGVGIEVVISAGDVELVTIPLADLGRGESLTMRAFDIRVPIDVEAS